MSRYTLQAQILGSDFGAGFSTPAHQPTRVYLRLVFDEPVYLGRGWLMVLPGYLMSWERFKGMTIGTNPAWDSTLTEFGVYLFRAVVQPWNVCGLVLEAQTVSLSLDEAYIESKKQYLKLFEQVLAEIREAFGLSLEITQLPPALTRDEVPAGWPPRHLR